MVKRLIISENIHMYSIFIKVLYPEIFLSFCILGQLIFNSRLVNSLKFNYPLINTEIFIQGLFILICLFLIICNQKIDIIIPNFLFFCDFSIRILKIIIIFFAIILFFFVWKSFILQTINFFEYFIFYFFSLLSALLLLNCSDLIAVYLVIEIQALAFYILASFKRTSSFSTEAGLKYFIIGAISSSFFLLGSFFIYACLGTTNINNIEILLSFPLITADANFNNIVFFGFFLIVITLFFKIIVAPFHFWAPDVYEGSPLGTTIIFSILPKISIFTFLINWLLLFLHHNFILKILLLSIGLFSVLYGAYCAIFQKRLKRFIIYSSISQIGFLVIALSVCDSNSISAIYFFLFVYIFTSLMLWGNIISYNHFNKVYNKFYKISENPLFISDLSLYFRKNYVWAISFAIIFFSFSGIPPLSGFLAKVLIIFSVISDWNIIVAICLVLITIISSYYYLRIIKILFFDKDLVNTNINFLITEKSQYFEIDCLIISLISFGLIFIFFFPNFLIILSFLLSIILL